MIVASRIPAWFVEPAVFVDVDNSHAIAQVEVFGPVVTITPYTDDDDAVRIANDSEYGLAGTVGRTIFTIVALARPNECPLRDGRQRLGGREWSR